MIGIVCVIVVIVAYAVYCRKWYLNEQSENIPYIGVRFPLFGSLYDVIAFVFWRKERFYDDLVTNMNTYGTVNRIQPFGAPQIVFLSDAKCIEHILSTNFHNYIKGPRSQSFFRDFLGNGIFNVNGSEWKRQRKTASHMFSSRDLQSMVPIWVSHALKLCHVQMDTICGTGEPVDAQEAFGAFTLDSFVEIAFGSHLGMLDSPPMRKRFAFAFQNIQKCPKWAQKLMPTEHKLKPLLKFLNDVAYDIIGKRRRSRESGTATSCVRFNFLDKYLDARDEDDQPFSDQYIRDIIVNFMLAGRDTTAQALTWSIYHLCTNPSAMEAALKEVHDVFPQLTSESEESDVVQALTWDALKVESIPYLHAVVKETLRLSPPVPFDPKYALEDDVLPGGFRIKAGTAVAWVAYAQGRNPDTWHEPEAFRPKRHLDAQFNGDKPKPHPYAYTPFQAGPRRCLGERMAMLEVCVMLIIFLKRYRPHLVPGVNDVPPLYSVSITFNARNGMPITVEKRQ